MASHFSLMLRLHFSVIFQITNYFQDVSNFEPTDKDEKFLKIGFFS